MDDEHDDKDKEKRLVLYNVEFLESISEIAPLLKKALDKRNAQKVKELLAQSFVDNLATSAKIRALLGKAGQRFESEELANIHRNILNLIK